MSFSEELSEFTITYESRQSILEEIRKFTVSKERGKEYLASISSLSRIIAVYFPDDPIIQDVFIKLIYSIDPVNASVNPKGMRKDEDNIKAQRIIATKKAPILLQFQNKVLDIPPYLRNSCRYLIYKSLKDPAEANQGRGLYRPRNLKLFSRRLSDLIKKTFELNVEFDLIDSKGEIIKQNVRILESMYNAAQANNQEES